MQGAEFSNQGLPPESPISEDDSVIPFELLDEAGLDATLRPFGDSRILPVAAYTSAVVLDWERENFFAGTWTCIGRRPPTGQRAYAVSRMSILVTAAPDGTVRAFANVCRHRGHELLPVGEDSSKRA